ncbi:hypothetical protein FGO68_gene5575 [Halteria grandinella]|uniref:Uncharacterized protein n=1 Tax=Halteria grandinella TaxID=5974 RepID=A0A8J8T074_HALGN|nr:hypothetical protein FGO68_gene5575 [Halteria grandinella]
MINCLFQNKTMPQSITKFYSCQMIIFHFRLLYTSYYIFDLSPCFMWSRAGRISKKLQGKHCLKFSRSPMKTEAMI